MKDKVDKKTAMQLQCTMLSINYSSTMQAVRQKKYKYGNTLNKRRKKIMRDEEARTANNWKLEKCQKAGKEDK